MRAAELYAKHFFQLKPDPVELSDLQFSDWPPRHTRRAEHGGLVNTEARYAHYYPPDMLTSYFKDPYELPMGVKSHED